MSPITTQHGASTRPFFQAGWAGLLVLTLAGPPAVQGPAVTPLMTKTLPDVPGREVLMIAVQYAPGEAEVVHRHGAHAFVYVLEGSIVMQVKGGKQVTLHPGETFYEGPDDIHVVGRNASNTKPARFVVLILKSTGQPAVLPVP